MTSARYLNFHGIGEPGRALEPGEHELWIEPSSFEGVVSAVAERPEVHLTFDDANASDHSHALPVLLEHDLHATFFVLSGRLDCPGSLTSSQVRELASAGMSIGTHGMHHISWRKLDPALRVDELRTARLTLEDLVQRPVRQASLPFGQYDARTLRQLIAERYEHVLTSDGYWRRGTGLVIPRRTIHRNDTADAIHRLVEHPPTLLLRAVGAAKQFIKIRR